VNDPFPGCGPAILPDFKDTYPIYLSKKEVEWMIVEGSNEASGK
jgi:hypothetical protein